VGFRYLPRKDVKTVGLFGAAGRAANQLLALKCERPITHVKIYSRNPENRRRFAEKYGPMFDLDITPVDSPRDAVKGVDVIACATNTNSVLFDGDWLEPGQHVTGIIGSNVALVKAGFLRYRRREIDDRTAVRADVIVTNLKESVISEEQGDLFEPLEKGLIPFREDPRSRRAGHQSVSRPNERRLDHLSQKQQRPRLRRSGDCHARL